MAEVTQSEIGQKQKLQTVLEAVRDVLRPHGRALQWNVDCESPPGRGSASSQLATLAFITPCGLAFSKRVHTPAL